MSKNNSQHFLSVNPEDYLINPGRRRGSRDLLTLTMSALDVRSENLSVSSVKSSGASSGAGSGANSGRRSSVSPGMMVIASELDIRRTNQVPTLRVSSSSKELFIEDDPVAFDELLREQLLDVDESLNSGKHKRKQQNLLMRIHEPRVYRPRCNTDPGPKQAASSSQATPALLTPQPSRKRRSGSSALSSLIEQTLKVTSASMGLQGAGSMTKTMEEKEEARLPNQIDLNNDEKGVKYRIPRGKLRGSFTTSRSHDDPSASPTPPPPSSTSPATNSLHEAVREQNSSPEYSSSSAAGAGASESLATFGSHNRNDARSLKHSSSTPLVTSAGSVLSISPSRNSVSFSGGNTAKNEQSSSSAAATAAAAASSSSTPPEKEKKRKEVSSSRVKKFHRHFSQVSKDEKLINYFSCALVSDILLQGHLYITDQHFAFYSNVFGYVTKVVIPTSSVTKISKEKTAKIIPNAVGVATADERHVFGSFISREAAFRLMCSVCPPLAPVEILPKITADVEYLEEMSIEDDSSCSISGNESPPQGADGANTNTTSGTTNDESSSSLLRRKGGAGGGGGVDVDKVQLRNSDIPSNAKTSITSHSHAGGGALVGVRASAPPSAHYNNSNKSSSNSHHHNSNNQHNNNNNTGSQSNSTNNNNNNNNNNSMSSLSKLGLPTSLLTTPTTGAAASAATNLTMIIAGTASSTSVSSTPSPSTSTTSSPTTVMNPIPKIATTTTTTTDPNANATTTKQTIVASFKTLSKTALMRLKFPTEYHIVYVGMLLALILAIFSGFLLYRILDIEAKTSVYRSPVVNWGSVNDDDIFVEALRWQRELQSKSSEEVQSILNTNLEQIAKVRRSLETLSMLIHDRSFASAPTTTTTSSTSPAEAFHRDDSD